MFFVLSFHNRHVIGTSRLNFLYDLRHAVHHIHTWMPPTRGSPCVLGLLWPMHALQRCDADPYHSAQKNVLLRGKQWEWRGCYILIPGNKKRKSYIVCISSTLLSPNLTRNVADVFIPVNCLTFLISRTFYGPKPALGRDQPPEQRNERENMAEFDVNGMRLRVKSSLFSSEYCNVYKVMRHLVSIPMTNCFVRTKSFGAQTTTRQLRY